MSVLIFADRRESVFIGVDQVYESALLRELELPKIRAVTQAPFSVIDKGHPVGEYNEHGAQCLNYLRASGRSACLLVNF